MNEEIRKAIHVKDLKDVGVGSSCCNAGIAYVNQKLSLTTGRLYKRCLECGKKCGIKQTIYFSKESFNPESNINPIT